MSPPEIHIRNEVESSIRTLNNNFVSGKSGTDKLFPMHMWGRLLDQAQITLSIIRLSRHYPNISVHMMIEGNFDFNKKPLAPPGIKVIFHENSA